MGAPLAGYGAFDRFEYALLLGWEENPFFPYRDCHTVSFFYGEALLRMSPKLARAPSVNSHTTTNEWQSFEARMRRRRADRFVLRASAALDADVREARDLLDEARAVCPAHPEIQGLTNRLRSQLVECDRAPALPWSTAALVALEPAGAVSGYL